MGPVVHKFCVGKIIEIKTQIFEDEFQGILLKLPIFFVFFTASMLHTFAKNSKWAWSHFGSNIRGKHHLGREAVEVHFSQDTNFGFCASPF